MHERWRRIDELFAAAHALPPDARRAFLDDACRDDRVLRDEVLSLLDADRRSGSGESIRDALAAVAQRVVLERQPSAAGRAIGPYRMIRELGRGGMGTVFLASPEDRPDALVAVKVIRQDDLTPDLERRFDREGAILARLADPGIARLLDAGTTPEGITYLVMEYVDGAPIDQHCERRELFLSDRLFVFRKVCVAVQHAHDMDVIHRDLKPSNILITNDGEPRLVDFGIAKLLRSGIGVSGATSAMVSRMTPAYASPEQVAGGPLTVATDVYSLGVVLYELIAKDLPYHLAGEIMARQDQIIATQDPRPPSEAARDMKVAWADQITPALDGIVLTALRKRPNDRFPSVLALARAIDDWQADPEA